MGGATRRNRPGDSTHDTQEKAVERGVELARANHGQLRVKGENGQIRAERTYGDDPYPPNG
jgi:hypothetical protein